VGIELTVVLLPYEMQICAEAEATYRSLGVRWEDGFINRGVQRLLLQHLSPGVKVLDAYHAFGDESTQADWRSRNRVGQFFVYNAGDKLDWNRPNRAGHKAIAEFLVRSRVFETRPTNHSTSR
jgi:hypothetical protein